MLLVIAALVAVLLASYGIYKDFGRRTDTHNIVNITENQDQAFTEKYTLNNLVSLPGTDYLMVSLLPLNSSSLSYRSEYMYTSRNALFINAKDNSKHWLFPNNKYLITETDFLYENRDNSAKEAKVLAILYQIAKEDTDNDHKLTPSDKATIALSSPDGYSYQEVLSNLDNLIGYEQIDNESVFVIYESNKIAFSANISLNDFSITNQAELPTIKNDKSDSKEK